jgi:hypothetical protein
VGATFEIFVCGAAGAAGAKDSSLLETAESHYELRLPQINYLQPQNMSRSNLIEKKKLK